MASTGVERTEITSKSKKPSDSAFKQQKLPAWQPILTAGTVLPTFFVIGIAFIPIGVGLLYFSDEVKEYVVDYTHCNKTTVINESSNEYEFSNDLCSEVLDRDPRANCLCAVELTIPEDLPGDVYMYYGLSNYYQNHRRYVKSRDDNQLLGNLDATPSSDCTPFQMGDNGKPIAPCGAIANSLFNDTLQLKYNNGSFVKLNRTGIAWPSDKNIKFRNPELKSGETLEDVFKKNTAKPPHWGQEIWELDLNDQDNNGFQNEDLIVWMRTAALPTFRKLYRRIETSLPKGNYTVLINYRYPVTGFDGSKRVIISNTSILGGKNPFLGIGYIVVGCLCLILGVLLLFVHVKCSKSTSEMINVNPRTPY